MVRMVQILKRIWIDIYNNTKAIDHILKRLIEGHRKWLTVYPLIPS